VTRPQIWDLLDESRGDYRDEARPRPVRTSLWHPAAPHDDAPPVVLLSHGTGGAAGRMAWLAEPLVAAGFLVLAVDHHGNNSLDDYLPQGFAFEWERPGDLSFALSVLASERPLGPVGAAGFSSGGYTGAALVGARFDRAVLRAVMEGRVAIPELPEFPGFLDALRTSVPAERLERALADAGEDRSDSRVRAAFLVCPANGAMLTAESLAAIDRPVEIRWGDADTNTPPEENALRYLDTIPTAGGRSAGPDVEHYHFLGDNPAGEETRRRVAAEAVGFFTAQLRTALPKV
jgi:predicted dienelactone hydrolase